MTAAFDPTFRRPPRSRLAFSGSWSSIAGLSLATCLGAGPRFTFAQTSPPPAPDAAPEARSGATGATIAVDPENNSLIIVGSPREVERLAALARQAQEALPVESSRIHSIRLGADVDANRLRSLVVQTLRTMNARGGAGAIARRVAIVADPTARTLVVAASPGDFRVVGELIAAFARTPTSERLTVRSYPLANTTAEQASRNLRQLLDAQRASAGAGPVSVRVEDPSGEGEALEATFDPARVRTIAEPSGNSLVVIAPEEAVAFVDRFIAENDALPSAEQASLEVYTLKHASAEQLARPVGDLLASRWRDQRRRDPSLVEPRVVADARNNALIVSAARPQLAELTELLETLDGGDGAAFAGGAIEVVPVRFADAADVARTLDRFLTLRARSAGLRTSEASVEALRSSNAVILGGSAEAIASLKGLVAQVDLPQTDDRAVEIVRIERGDARSIARLVGEQFSRRVIGGVPIAVSADTRTNSVVVNAPDEVAAEVLALIASLDSPDASDETILRTYQLTTARADEAVRLLTESLQLDASGRADGVSIRLDDAEEAVEVNARIVPDRRSNSLIVTATPESVPVIEALVTRIDEAPASSPLEFRIVSLEHATASEASYTLRQMLRAAEPGQTPPAIDFNSAENQLVIGATADQFPRIEELIEKLDQPRSRPRRTDFIALEFADAERVREALSYFYGPWADQADRPSQRNVSIVADPATNSLVISAEESEWEGIEGLLAKLDREDYDGSLQLRVFALDHADARGLARAINDAFRGQMEELRRRGRGGNNQRDRDDRDQMPPTTLVPAEEWVSVAAEENTNSLVVSASRANLNRIERIIEELDTADFGRLPAPRIIPVARGDAEQLAEAIVAAYDLDADGGDRTVRVVGDRSASALIVRADDADYDQIKTLAESLQAQAASQGLSVNLLTLENAPAARIADAIREAYTLRARQANLPLTISVDGSANALVVASTGPLFEEIRRTAEAMDRLSPQAGQAIFLIDLEHVDPEVVEQAITEIGLDEEQDADSARRIVGEPVRVATLPGRRSILVVASPADRAAVTGFVKAIDAAPPLPSSRLRVVPLKLAEAASVAAILEELVDPNASGAGGELARAAREQIRRLSLRRDGVDEPDLELNLDTPIRILADEGLNALLIDSSPENVAALETIAGMLDELPLTSAVAVQFLPLEHIAAAEFARLVRELFQQGATVGRIPGTDREGVPAGAVGPALLEPVAMTVDERTNTVIVAGREEAVALVEVLKQRVDDGVTMGWVEPRVIELEYADAVELAATLEAVLVSGRQDLPD
ncbi:MAG: secretin N-terminal domain-containing protein, partial [Planctomycetota bacterium]